MLSIFFEIVTSEEMQGDASDMLQLKLGQKNDFFGSFWEGFVYALWRPMRYAPKFFQMKDFIKTHIRGKFNQYSIGSCEVKNF